VLGANELKAELKITEPQLRAWMRDGMPAISTKPRRFDEAAVHAWLLKTGKIEPEPQPEQVVTTRAELAQVLGVNTRTVAEWLNDPDFPGQAGQPGRANGYFPVEKIRAWMAARPQYEDESSELNSALKRERLEKLRLENAETAGRLIDRAAVEGWVARKAALARQRLATLEPIVMGSLPPEIDARVKAQLAVDVRSIIDQMLTELARSYRDKDDSDDQDN
jgi:hypothetical protein